MELLFPISRIIVEKKMVSLICQQVVNTGRSTTLFISSF